MPWDLLARCFRCGRVPSARRCAAGRLLFVALVAGLVALGPNPAMASVTDASWLLAAYFAVAWLLLIGVIVRPARRAL